MDPARHEQVVEAFFKCHPQAISDIFREFLAGNRVWVLDSGRDWVENPKVLTNILESAVSERRN